MKQSGDFRDKGPFRIGSKIDETRIDGNLSRLRDDLITFSKLGLDVVEVPVHGLDCIMNGKMNIRRLNEVKEILKDFDFHYSVHSPNPLNLMSRDNKDMHYNVFVSSLEFTQAIGSRVMVYHSGRFIPEETFHIHENEVSIGEQKRLLEQEREMLKLVAADFYDVKICMENARPYRFHSPYCYAELLERLKKQVLLINEPNVCINLDVGHLNMAAKFYGLDPVKEAGSVIDLVGHTHIHDNFGNAVYHYEKQQTHQLPFGAGDSHIPVGWGIIPIKEIISLLLPVYEGFFMMELRSRYFEYIGESKDSLERILWEIMENMEQGDMKLGAV